MTEFGVVIEPVPGHTARLARRAEQAGWDAFLCPDTQCNAGEVHSQLALAAAATERIRLGTGVTNPITRDVSVTAAALAGLQIESGGRAICGLGRGDSSAAHIGGRPATQDTLRTYAQRLRAYLRGETVDRDGTPSLLRWMPATFTPPPIDVAATGPRTIALAADVADRVSFAVGAAPERLGWALDVLKARLAETGRDRSELSIGAYLNVVADPDPDRAVALARTGVGLVAHFAALRGAPLEHLPPPLREAAERLREGYDMQRHAREGARHLTEVSDEFVRWFAITGTPEEVGERLRATVALGLDHVYLLGGTSVAAPLHARMDGLLDVHEVLAEQIREGARWTSS